MTSEATANGSPVLQGAITIPRVGAWRAELEVSQDDAAKLTGAVEVKVGTQTWKGTSVDVGDYAGRVKLRVVGGKGGLGKATAARYYASIPARVVASDALGEGGEALSSTASAALLASVLPFWTRVAGTVAESLEQIVDELGASWRILDDGTVWVGTDTWTEAKLGRMVVTGESPADARVELAMDAHALRPGMAYRGKRVGEVEIRIAPEGVRTVAWFGEQRGDVLRSALAGLVRQETKHLDLYAIRGGSVVSQNGDGTLELRLDDPRFPGMSKVPIAYGIPGIDAKVAGGARVLVEFEGGSPAKPRAVVYDSAKLTQITIKASAKVIIDAPDVESQKGGRPLARVGDPVMVISTPPGLPATGQIMAGNPRHRG